MFKRSGKSVNFIKIFTPHLKVVGDKIVVLVWSIVSVFIAQEQFGKTWYHSFPEKFTCFVCLLIW